MDKKSIEILPIATLTTVSTASLSYYILSQSNQTPNSCKGRFETGWHEIFLASEVYLPRDSGSEYTVFSPEGQYFSTDGLRLAAQVAV
jgi:hypothetical protein